MATTCARPSTYGHVEAMAKAVAEGVEGGGRRCHNKMGAGVGSEEVARKAGFKLPGGADRDGVGASRIRRENSFGTPTRFGNIRAQMRAPDQAGGLWVEGKLVGKAASIFCSTGTQHGGQETTITTFHVTLCDLGFIIVPPGYTSSDILNMEIITAEVRTEHRPSPARTARVVPCPSTIENCTLSGALRGEGGSEARRLTSDGGPGSSS